MSEKKEAERVKKVDLVVPTGEEPRVEDITKTPIHKVNDRYREDGTMTVVDSDAGKEGKITAKEKIIGIIPPYKVVVEGVPAPKTQEDKED